MPSKSEKFSNSFICKNERITFMARNLNLKYISNRRLQRDIHEKFSGGFSDVMRGGVLLKSLWIFSVLVVLLI